MSASEAGSYVIVLALFGSLLRKKGDSIEVWRIGKSPIYNTVERWASMTLRFSVRCARDDPTSAI
jgi:hypothetical protein